VCKPQEGVKHGAPVGLVTTAATAAHVCSFVYQGLWRNFCSPQRLAAIDLCLLKAQLLLRSVQELLLEQA
jgi:hypothetical protein